jgi:hypothetical protein
MAIRPRRFEIISSAPGDPQTALRDEQSAASDLHDLRATFITVALESNRTEK